MSLAELNSKLQTQSYVGGFSPSKADAALFEELFGNNTDVIAWVAKMASYYQSERKELAVGGGKAPKEEKKKGKEEKKEQPKKEDKKKKEQPKKEDKKKEDKKAEKKEEKKEGGFDAKLVKEVKKEAGKKAQDLAGMADMGSLFGQAVLLKPEGKVELMDMALEAMNAEVDPAAEERKGGAGGVGKIVLSNSDNELCIFVHVPEELTDASKNERNYAVSAEEWLESALSTLPGDGKGAEILAKSKTLCKCHYKNDPENGRFVLKAKDAVSSASFAFLRSKSLVVDNDSDSDEMVFGDDDMPGY